MINSAFVDTNVIVYLFDGRFPGKQRTAGELLQQLVRERMAPFLSTQVLQEAYCALTRKLNMDSKSAISALQDIEAAGFTIQPVDVPLIWRAAARSAGEQLSFWDGLIVEAAREAGCAVLYSEDLQDGRVFDQVTVRNPFV